MHLSQEQGVTNPKEEGTPHRDPTPHRVPTPHKVPTPLKEGIKGVHLQPGVTPGQDSHHHPGDTQGHHQVAPIKVEDLHLQGHTHRKVNVRFSFNWYCITESTCYMYNLFK